MPVSAADVTRAMLANINSIREGLVFDATQDSLHDETSDLGEIFLAKPGLRSSIDT